MAHSTSNPDGCRGVVTPSDYLYAATLRLQELFLQYECMFRSAVFDFWWDDTDEAWRFAVEYSYDQETWGGQPVHGSDEQPPAAHARVWRGRA